MKDLRPVKLMMFSRMDTLRLNSSSVEVSNCICSSISPLSPSSLLPQKSRVLGAKAGDFPFCYWKSHQLILRVTYAPLSTSVLLRDPRLLVRTDLHSPAWGSFSTLDQPVSRAKSPPPVSILKHNAKITSPPSQLWKKRARARTTSKREAIQRAQLLHREDTAWQWRSLQCC